MEGFLLIASCMFKYHMKTVPAFSKCMVVSCHPLREEVQIARLTGSPLPTLEAHDECVESLDGSRTFSAAEKHSRTCLDLLKNRKQCTHDCGCAERSRSFAI